MGSSFLEESKRYAMNAAKKAAKDVAGSSSKKKKQGPLGDKDDPVDGLVRVAAAVVGFTSEAVQYRKEKKKMKAGEPSAQDTKSDEKSTADGTSTYARTSDDADESQSTFPSTSSKSAAEEMNEDIWRQDDEEKKIEVSRPLDTNTAPTSTPAEEATHDRMVPETQEVAKKPKEPKDLAASFLKRHPYSPSDSTQARMTVPVVMPQRRPKDRARGFVRAYAPVLASAGIDQETFLDFVDTFNKSLEPNPYLNVINLAGFAGEAAPEPFTMLIGLAVDVGTYALLEADSRNRSARFLDRVNAEFFMPRGLVCFCATWRSDDNNDEKLVTAVDFEGKQVEAPTETGFEKYAREVLLQKSSRDEVMRKLQQQIQDRMKPCSGAFDWPDPATLVFPSADETKAVLCTKPDGKKKSGLDRGEVWMDNFSDRRAQAKWIRKNPDFNVATTLPKPEFRSRYADPSHPASSGDIVAFATAGRWSTRGRVPPAGIDDHRGDLGSEDEQEKLQPRNSDKVSLSSTTETEAVAETEKEREKREKKEEKQKKKDEKKEKEKEKEKEKAKEKERKKNAKRSKNGFRTLFQKDVLYLIIIDIRPDADGDISSQDASQDATQDTNHVTYSSNAV